MEQFFTLQEVAKILKVHENTVRNILKSGGIRGIKVGREWRITGTALKDFAREAEQTYLEEDHSIGKYAALTRFLRMNGQRTIEMSFAEIENVLAFPLPPSARKYNAWWHEEKNPRAQKIAWSEAGYFVRRYSTREERVVFQRKLTDETFIEEVRSSHNPQMEHNVLYFLKMSSRLDLDVSWDECEDQRKVVYKLDHNGQQHVLLCLYTNGILETHLHSLRRVPPFHREELIDRLVSRLSVIDGDAFRGEELQCPKLDLAGEKDTSVLNLLGGTVEWIIDMVRGQEILMGD